MSQIQTEVQTHLQTPFRSLARSSLHSSLCLADAQLSPSIVVAKSLSTTRQASSAYAEHWLSPGGAQRDCQGSRVRRPSGRHVPPSAPSFKKFIPSFQRTQRSRTVA